jgi:hypothetical protein
VRDQRAIHADWATGPAIERSAPINAKIRIDESTRLARYTIDSCAEDLNKDGTPSLAQ